MRLKKLILHGFKSFADRTEFLFDAPITGIVGPNGCGKSNVVDGFKWVLGEQSAKSLRGQAMMDVIFNGSGTRKPSALAEVTLVFDNPRDADGKRTLNLEVDDVAIGRRLYRDGTSEYQINTQISRLKDVRELFLDTGVGVDAYSVIEQGRVAALLEANPEERRLIFEEAAGISKFKQRKKEALRKLEKVDQNLLRVTDIVDEVEKRLRGVKVQAGRARTFQEHSARLAELRLAHTLREYHTQREKAAELARAHEDAQFRLDDSTGDLSKAQNDLALARERFDALSQQKQKLEYDLVQTKASLQSAKQRQQYARQQLEQIAEQVASFAQDQTEAQSKFEALSQSLQNDIERLEVLTQELNDHRKLIDQRQQAYRDGQLRLNTLTEQIESAKASILDLMRKAASANNRLGAIEIERRNVASQSQRLGDRRSVLDEELAKLETTRISLEDSLDKTVALLRSQQGALEAKRVEAASLGKQIAQTGERLGAAKEHRSGLASRQKLLKDLEARREGVSEGVKSVLKQRETRFAFVRGLVADLLRVDVEHAHVIEAALDGRDQWLVTQDCAAALDAAESLAKLEGRVNLICADRLPAPVSPPDWLKFTPTFRIAADLVRSEPGDAALANHLLGRTLVVEALADVATLCEQGLIGYRCVTRAGEVIEADGTLRAGPLTAAMGLLSRRSELQSIGQQIADVDSRIATLTRQMADDSTLSRNLEEEIGSLRNSIYTSNTAKVEATSALAQNADKQNGIRREQPVLERELAQLTQSTQRLEVEGKSLLDKRVALESEQAQRQAEVDDRSGAHKTTSDELRELGEQLTASRVALGQVQEKQLAAGQSVQRQTAARGELLQQIERMKQAAASLTQKRSAIEGEIAHALRAEAALLAAQQSAQTHLTEIASQLSGASESVAALTALVQQLRELRQEIEDEFHALALQAGEAKVRLETLVQRASDEAQINLPEHYESLDAAGGYQPALLDWDAVSQEIKELREKIQRLGNVNVDAIDEQTELEERQKFLSTQVNDLSESKRQLEALIEEINLESSLRFEATFNAVREHFQGMFRKLFGGGKADIYLETELGEKKSAPEGEASLVEPAAPKRIDVLDAGIEIIARPPGKQPVSISQLSGGEKTMTCIALLMSIFKSKPSAFCILDEVDAALDEANNQRFNLIIREFLDQSQFIVITHSKRTMQIAETLYGVTMQEQGVSKRVAVKFDQVDAQGRINEHAAA